MAATHTVSNSTQSRNFRTDTTTQLVPRHGVVTLYGYGINVRVDRGHLICRSGISTDRQNGRFARVGHGLRRLVVVGSDGMVSLAALRWLADQRAAFVMLERDGSVLAVTGPVGPSDARLRRAQALARQSQLAVNIARELISQKLAGQEWVIREKFQDQVVADTIARAAIAVRTAGTIEVIRSLEAQAAQAYWSAWYVKPITFPKNDLGRVPSHWLTFGTRKSPLSGSPRLAANPANAMLNYLYAVLESEARLAAAALGLDPGIGFLHVDTDARDSLACDLMEAVRPQIDAYLLDWIDRQPFCRHWFFEKNDGNCRLMGPLCVRLSETAQTWGSLIAPVAEWISRTLWSTIRNPRRVLSPTHLTQNHRRQVKATGFHTAVQLPPQPPRLCPRCGSSVKPRKKHCVPCAIAMQRQGFLNIAERGRVAAHTPGAEAKRGETQRKRFVAQHNWKSSDQPSWLDEAFYVKTIRPQLVMVKIKAVAASLGVSIPYASLVCAGQRLPHPRHWQKLAQLAGVSRNSFDNGME